MEAGRVYEVGFYEEADGSSPVFRWITEELSPAQRRSVTAALEELVARMGPDIVRTDFGKNLGGGLIELRIRQSEEQLLKRMGKVPRAPHPEDAGEDILLRVFFHPHGEKRALVLHGYDKGKSPAKRHQQRQIAIADKRLALFKQREKERARSEGRKKPSPAKPKGLK
jgi:phage-related protein